MKEKPYVVMSTTKFIKLASRKVTKEERQNVIREKRRRAKDPHKL